MFVIGVQLGEIVHEAGLGQEAALGIDRHHVVAFAGLHQPVQPEHVLDPGLGLQSQVDVVAEQQQIRSNLHDVATDAVVLAADPEAADDFQPAVTELDQALAVERVGQPAQTRALLAQAAAQDFVGTALGDRLIDSRGGFRRRGVGTGGGIRHRLPSGSRKTGRGTGRCKCRAGLCPAQRASTTVADTVSVTAVCSSAI